ncbi:hypothetical protein KAR91_48725 [Candidatus Pacearchaeota archaeon]|nr:hypothetical protein [Candidatus Pacearchaeota archaeon]
MTASLTNMVETIVERIFSSVHTCIPGRIEKYDFTTQKAEVQPLIKIRYNDDIEESVPVIPNVPVQFLGSSESVIHFPLKRGDTGLIHFSERAMETWLSLGGETGPGDYRKFDLSDAIFVPGLRPFSAASLADNNDDFIVQYKGTGLRIKKNGDVEVGGASFLKLINENFKTMFNSHVHQFTDIIYPVGTPSIAVTGGPANITGAGAPDPGTNPMVVPALPIAIGDNEMTSKVKVE